MKGLVFTEFLEMVEKMFSLEMVEKIISKSKLSTGGAYTAVGTYDHRELIELVSHLSEFTGTPIPELEKVYGKFLFTKLVSRYGNLITENKDAFSFMQSVDKNIHVEVKKLYPEAELPRFESELVNPNHLIMDYYSTRPFADVAEGLLNGCIEYFNENISIQRESIKKDGKIYTRFNLQKQE